jgi:hypothetical protein
MDTALFVGLIAFLVVMLIVPGLRPVRFWAQVGPWKGSDPREGYAQPTEAAHSRSPQGA